MGEVLVKKRNERIDIIKGLGIILMVWVHAGGPFGHFWSLFHMPIFFIASGWCCNVSFIKDLKSLMNYVKKKYISLWAPFTIYNGMLTIMHNVFLEYNIYSTDAVFLEEASAVTKGEQYLFPMLGIKDILYRLFKNLLFAGDCQLGGATWFLRTLFCVTVGHAVVQYLDNCLFKRKIAFYFSIVMSIVGTTIVCLFRLKLPMGIHTCFAAYLIYEVGILLRKLDLMKYIEHKKVLIISSIGILAVMNQFGSIGMAIGWVTNVLFFLVVSLVGWIMLWNVSDVIPKFFKKGISYCGTNSLWIMLLHFICFKFVSYIYLIYSGKSIILLAAFPTLQDNKYIWSIYTFVGICFPLLIEYVLKYIILKFKKIMKAFQVFCKRQKPI